MQRNSIHDYFFFGTAIRYLQDAKAGHIVTLPDGVWYVAVNVSQVLAYLERLDLRVTSRTKAAYELKDLSEELAKLAVGAVLDEQQAARLAKIISELRSTLDAELAGAFAYTLTPKRLDVQRLVEDPSSLLAPSVFQHLPDIAKYDLAAAGKCIAFELPTSAAFHILRATEAVLRQFYSSLVIRGAKARMWGEIVAELRKKRTASKHTELLNHLDHIRTAFRNPTQHPEARYDISEVQDLWSLAADVINRMVRASSSSVA